MNILNACVHLSWRVSIIRFFLTGRRSLSAFAQPRLVSPTRLISVLSTPAGATPAPAGALTELSRMEIRVGKIVNVAKHPTLPKIFVEQIDLGEPTGPRTICSGLQVYLYPLLCS